MCARNNFKLNSKLPLMQPILKINLSTCETSNYYVPEKWEKEFLGGSSLAARLLYTDLHKDLDPLSHEAPLLFLTGPLTGTAGPAVGRFVVCGKSPATNLWAESNCGGFWGPELRSCGYDGLWITGKANHPVYLWIFNEEVKICDATSVWGKDTDESQTIIKTEINNPRAHVLTIGPAGENGVLFAGLFCDHGRTAGRTGLGAVAGAKKLKAITVYGNKKIPIAYPNDFAILRTKANLALKQDTITQVTHELGTAGVADYADYIGSMPKKYYSQGTMDNVGNISGATMAETILSGVRACHGCVIACGRVVNLGDGIKRKGPEYETIAGFGSNLLNINLKEIVRLNELCDRLGLDTISTSNTIGLAYLLYEKGIIDLQDVGFSLIWGDTSAAHRLIKLISDCEGIGALMAQGSRKFASYYGVEDEAVQVNGLELAFHDPRGVSGMALVYATSPRGACHNKSDYFFVDWGQADPNLGMEYFETRAGSEKAVNVARHQDWRSLCDSLVLCFFGNVPIYSIKGLINTACDYDYSVDDLLRVGERGWTLKRVINIRMGLTSSNDVLPKALIQPLKDGNSAGYVPPIKEMLSAYYTARDWDPISGRPSKEKLLEMGLDEAIRDLWV
jgi:aldehyde:ferredoxin oxidoreductase